MSGQDILNRLLRLAAFCVPLALYCPPLAAGPASDLARAIRENTLDRDACYRVRDLTLFKEDIRIYLTDGYLIFSKPVAGRPIAALFTTEVENGSGEVILRPPNAAERRSLASYIGSPNLDEQFQAALFFFTGDVYQSLLAQLPNNPTNRKMPEVGALLEEKWNPALRNFSSRLDLRLALDLLNSALVKPDLFSASFQDAKLGNFDLVYDPGNTDEISADQMASRGNHVYFDVWTHFSARSSRDRSTHPGMPIELSDYRISATVSPDLNLSAVTKVKVKTNREGLRIAPFDIAQEMAVSEVRVNGTPAEFVQRDEAMRGGPGGSAGGESSIFLVMPPTPLHAGEEYEFEFHYSGKVILDAGGRVYYVTARGNWYPNLGGQFATFDLTFRYPRDLELVTPGEVIEDRTEGEWRITRRRPAAPIRLAGFNLGDYAHARVSAGGYLVDVCGNRTVEPALRVRPTPDTLVLPNPGTTRRRIRGPVEPSALVTPAPVLNPMERLQKLATNISGMIEFMASKFGPPALAQVTVSPIPGNFGQGYPGLIYLSTRSYLSEPATPSGPTAPNSQVQEIFFDELLEVHETAHQWWGAQVAGASYHDDWLMEALANYSAMLYLEKTRGGRELDELLNEYRMELLAHRDNGEPVDSAGPIVLGTRLESSLEPRAWRAITYGKGSWILHMLRRRMGDERFLSMMAEVMKRYGHSEITTEQFRMLAAEFLPPKSDDPQLETFFDQWVYGTGIPTLKLTYRLRGKAGAWKLIGTLTQSDVADDFEALAPVEMQLPQGQTITRWVRASNEPATFQVALTQAPVKVVLDPHSAVLRR
jgi:Peptidase family M1 domain